MVLCTVHMYTNDIEAYLMASFWHHDTVLNGRHLVVTMYVCTEPLRRHRTMRMGDNKGRVYVFGKENGIFQLEVGRYFEIPRIVGLQECPIYAVDDLSRGGGRCSDSSTANGLSQTR